MSRVFIGVGHGGKDPGAVANGLREKDVNLVMALEMAKILSQHGVEVGLSRTKDENDPLQEELAEAKAFHPDLAVEVHNNAGGGDGFEVYVQTGTYKEQSRKLAQLIEEQVKQIGQNSRGIKTRLMANGQDYFGWLRLNLCPAVLCEGAFLDSPDREILSTETEQQAFGQAYAKAVLDYLGIPFQEKKLNPDTKTISLQELGEMLRQYGCLLYTSPSPRDS